MEEADNKLKEKNKHVQLFKAEIHDVHVSNTDDINAIVSKKDDWIKEIRKEYQCHENDLKGQLEHKMKSIIALE